MNRTAAEKATREIQTWQKMLCICTDCEKQMADIIERACGQDDALARYKPLCIYCRDGYKPQKFPTGWGHDDVPEKPGYGSWPHGCKAGTALQAELDLLSAREERSCGETAWVSVEEFYKTFPHCMGYPGCDGDLVGMPHEAECPLFGKQAPTMFEFAEAYAKTVLDAANKTGGNKQAVATTDTNSSAAQPLPSPPTGRTEEK